MKKKLEMNLLNDEKLHGVSGGIPPHNKCHGRGDIIDQTCDLAYDSTLYYCAIGEASCGSGFTYKCGAFDLGCVSNFKTRELRYPPKPTKYTRD